MGEPVHRRSGEQAIHAPARRTLVLVSRPDQRSPRVLVALLGSLAVLVALSLPAPADVAPAAVAALAVALAGLLAVRRSPLAVAPARSVTPRTAHDGWATLRGRVHDPVHHPRRPRAPGAG